MFRARLSISEVHFFMMKGMPSGLFLAAWAKSTPNRCSLPWSFLWPHWMARVSRHFLWQAKEHYGIRDYRMTNGSTEQCELNQCGRWWWWCTSSHSAPWNTTRLSHSLHLEGALSFRNLWVCAAFDIWVLRKGPGELAASNTISERPETRGDNVFRKLICK